MFFTKHNEYRYRNLLTPYLRFTIRHRYDTLGIRS